MLKIIGITSGLLSAGASIPYIIDILKRKTKPEKASWFIWTVLGTIAFFSQMAKGATNSLWMNGLDTIAVITIFILSIRYGTGGLVKRDIVALIFAVFGLIVWYFTKEAAFALYIVLAIDLAGSVLTVVKSHEDPGSETLISWILFGLAGLLSAISVGEFNFILLIYPIYICLANWSVVVAMLLGKRKQILYKDGRYENLPE